MHSCTYDVFLRLIHPMCKAILNIRIQRGLFPESITLFLDEASGKVGDLNAAFLPLWEMSNVGLARTLRRVN